MRHLSGYYVSCRNPLTKQENAFINLGCIFVAIRDRLGSFRLLTHPSRSDASTNLGRDGFGRLGTGIVETRPMGTNATARDDNPGRSHV